MKNFSFALKKELTKLIHKKKYIVLLVLGLLFTLIRWGGAALISRISHGEVVLRTNITMEMLPFVVEVMIPIIIFVAASDLFTHEFSSDTMKACIMQPVTRFKLLTAKASAIMIFASGCVLVTYIVNTVIQLLSGGTIEQAPITLAAYLIDIIPLIGIAFLGITVNTLLRSSATSTLLSIAIYALMKYMGLYVAGAESFLFTAGAKLHLMILGTPLPFHILLYKFGILFGSILILYSISYIIFDKKNV